MYFFLLRFSGQFKKQFKKGLIVVSIFPMVLFRSGNNESATEVVLEGKVIVETPLKVNYRTLDYRFI